MTSPSAATQVSKLTLPKQPPTPFPSPPSGCVWLYQDANWSSTKFEVRISDYAMRSRHTLPSSIRDKIDYIAFNLPLGTVMTVTDVATTTPTNKPLADLSGCDGTLDLVGNGQVKAVMTTDGNLKDAISGFFWREVDLNQGALEIFQHFDFAGNFATIFLSEWPRDQINGLGGWWINDNTSSIRWKSLNDRTQMTLYQHADGSGRRYENVKGWGSFKEIANLNDYDFNDYLSGFKWQAALPKKEIIEPITLSPPSASNARTYSHEETGENRTDLVQESTIETKEEITQTLTVETTDIHQVGITTSLSQTAKAGAEGVASTETTVSVAFSYNYTASQTTVKSDTKTTSITVTEKFSKPAQSRFKATLTVTMGSLPMKEYQVKATRWYDMQILDSVQDPQNNNWWKRQETVTFMIGGTIRSSKRCDVEATPLR